MERNDKKTEHAEIKKWPLIGSAIFWFRKSKVAQIRKSTLGEEDPNTISAMADLARERRRFGKELLAVLGATVIYGAYKWMRLEAVKENGKQDIPGRASAEKVDPNLAATISLRENLKKLLGDLPDSNKMINKMLEDPANERLITKDFRARNQAFRQNQNFGRFADHAYLYYTKSAIPKLKGLPEDIAARLPEGNFFVDDIYHAPDSPKVEWLRSHGLEFYDHSNRTFYISLNDLSSLQLMPLMDVRNSDPRPRNVEDPAEILELKIQTLDDDARTRMTKEFMEAAATGKEISMQEAVEIVEKFAKTYLLSDIIHRFDEKKPLVHVNAALSTAYNFLKFKTATDADAWKIQGSLAGEQEWTKIERKRLNEGIAYLICYRLSLDLSPEMDKFRPLLKELVDAPEKYFGTGRLFTIPE